MGVVWLLDPVSAGKEVVLIDGNGTLEDNVLLITNRVVVDARSVLVEEVCVTTGPERLSVVGRLAEVKFVCVKWDVTVEEFTDVLIATVASDVDVEKIVDFVVEMEVGSECEAPCGILREPLVEAEAAKVVRVPPVLKSNVEFNETKGNVLSRHEVDAVGA